MKVKELMHKEPITILPNATLHDVALKMKQQKIGSMLIVERGAVEGIVTDRDISIAVAADFKDPEKTFVSEIMTKDPVTIDGHADVDFALKVMKEKNVRRLPVCENGRVIGILSTADVAKEIRGEIDNFLGLEEAFTKIH